MLKTILLAVMKPTILVGGQAVIEGVMMRVPGSYATAVRDGATGQLHQSHSISSVINTNITLTAGSYLEGPIVQFKPSEGHWIGYSGLVGPY